MRDEWRAVLGVKTARCEPSRGAGGLAIRPYSLGDLPRLRRLFGPEILRRLGCQDRREFGTVPSIWRWIKTTFGVLYVIEIGGRGGRRLVGFVGLHDIRLGRSIRLSLGIFMPEDRGRGYGREALGLLLNSLARTGLAPAACVEVAATNVASLRLFSGMGFSVREDLGERFLLEKDLGRTVRISPGEGPRRPEAAGGGAR